MAHHKRRKPKSGRAGCLLCKPHKHQAMRHMTAHQKLQERKAREQHPDLVKRHPDFIVIEAYSSTYGSSTYGEGEE